MMAENSSTVAITVERDLQEASSSNQARSIHALQNAEATSEAGDSTFSLGSEEEEDVVDDDDDEDDEDEDYQNDLNSSKVLKTLDPAALLRFNEAQARAGVVYITRIPPGMRPAKVRHLMRQYGEVGRVYLQQEGRMHLSELSMRNEC